MKKNLFYLLLVSIFATVFLTSIDVEASVLVQGTEMSDKEYEDLLASIPEGNVLVSNEEFDALMNKRISSGLYHNAHVQTYGWQGTHGINYYAGVFGEAKRLEAIRLNFLNMGTSINYRMHVQGIGWQSWQTNGGIAGTVGRGLRAEAIQIKTSGIYGVSYRAHVQTYGWLDWVNSGTTDLFGYYAGTTGEAKRLEAIQFKLYRQAY